MDTIFELWHFKIGANDSYNIENAAHGAKDLGLYSTEERARMAMKRRSTELGFREWPNGFRVIQTKLDVCDWHSGLIV